MLSGILFGCICAFSSNDFSIGDVIRLNNYSLGNVYFNLVKYPILMFLSGFTVFGSIIVPICLISKGFSISFSITAIVQALGRKGVILAFAIFGLQTLISIPCFLVISASSIEGSYYIANTVFKRRKQLNQNLPNYKRHLYLFLFCSLLLLVYAAIDKSIVPALFSYLNVKF